LITPESFTIERLVRRALVRESLTALVLLAAGAAVAWQIDVLNLGNLGSLTDEQQVLVSFSGVLLLFGAALGVRAYWYREVSPSHPIVRSFARHGHPAEVTAKIRAEWEAPLASSGDSVLLRSWLIQISFTGVTIIPAAHVRWAYTGATKHSVNSVPVGTVRKVVIHTDNGKVRDMHDGFSSAVLAGIAEHWPWVVVGYSDSLQEEWTRDPGFSARNQSSHARLSRTEAS
jgi:hypothetical protein